MYVAELGSDVAFQRGAGPQHLSTFVPNLGHRIVVLDGREGAEFSLVSLTPPVLAALGEDKVRTALHHHHRRHQHKHHHHHYLTPACRYNPEPVLMASLTLLAVSQVTPGERPTQFNYLHSVATDSQGSVYAAEVSWTNVGVQQHFGREMLSLRKWVRA